MQLSKKSEQFLENLRLYLVTSGKKDKEINDIVNELEDHLREAEKRGKNVDKIIGRSPKEYMENLAGEMTTDHKMIMKILPVFLIGFCAFIALGDLIKEGIRYTWLELIGYPVTVLILLSIIIVSIKGMAANQIGEKAQLIIMSMLVLLQIGSFITLIFLKDQFGPPVFILNEVGNWIVGIIASLVLITISIWSKTWTPIFLPFAVYVPEVVLELDWIAERTGWSEVTNVFVSTGITFGLILIYILIVFRTLKQK
ncbi:HAAS domain-containing protein [Fervidibacillus halotolerans]|uniref:HAAS transmembrane region domain-containing protein n=1 Tax=Fervidibacillus halotolerans TaxID=2980027 RepID=A0A9E8M1G5_9BACI|nr:hypothetical protein [Fervidibacillus halotolerans]WAA13145.1 hypothetical protein OE105_03175 [Fervidibacillus halotolerans]